MHSQIETSILPRMKKISLILLLFIVLFQVSKAQENTRPEPKVTLVVHMRNGDQITGSSKIKTIIVSTFYGSLALPIESINKIQMGITNPNLDKEIILKMADKLRSSDPDEQQLAFHGLCAQEVGAISILKEYMQGESYIVATSSEFTVPAAISVLQAVHNIDEKATVNDIISFDDVCLVAGTCNISDKIEINAAVGSLQISRGDILTIDISVDMAESALTAKQFLITANKNISGNVDGGFFNTGIQLKAGKNFQISASGKVVLASLSNNNYTADGGINGAPAPSDGGTNAPSYGSLVFKIGENGTVLKAGINYKGKAVESGVLYLAIYETVFNPNNSGAYKVKVKGE